jgi:hypothetical protein
MGFGFRKSIKIAPGVRLNFSKSGIGMSAGVKGLRYSVNSRGQRRTTASIPGTGIYYTTTSSSRRSYNSKAYQRQRELQRQQREQEKLQERERNRLEVELFENKVEMIQSIHKESDTPVDWTNVKDTPAPFEWGSIGPNEREARMKLESYKPGFMSKLFHQDEKKHAELQENVKLAQNEDKADFDTWKAMVRTATRVVNGDIDAYFEVIQEFAPLDDLSEFGSGFEFSSENSSEMEIVFDVHSDTVVPKEILSLTKMGKVSRKQMPKGKYYEIQQDYVCSCALRIASDMFALLPLETVCIHAIDEQLNTATGHMEMVTILSVKIDRRTLNQLNLNAIDCSDSMRNFEHHMVLKKTQGFQPVHKIQL